MNLMNCLSFATPNGLSIKEMFTVKDKILNDFDWLSPAMLTFREIEPNKVDGTITFVFDEEPYEQVVCVTFDKLGVNLYVNSNDADVAIRVYQSLCELEWGWIEV